MITAINGQPAEWTPEIKAKWKEAAKSIPENNGRKPTVLRCNYFTPRPYRNEWDRGDLKEGFTYVTNFREVMQVCINGYMPWRVEEPPEGREANNRWKREQAAKRVARAH